MIPYVPARGSRLAAFDTRYGAFFAYLSVAFLLIVIIDLAPLPLTPTEQRLMRASEVAMYGIFVAEFGLRWWLSVDRRHYLRSNWLFLVILLLPFLRPLLFFRAANVAPTLTELAVSNRGLRGLFTLTRGRQMAYLLSLTVVVVLAGTGVVFTLERDATGTPLTSFGETLWWASTLITTVNSSDDPVTPWGRVVAVLLRLYAVGVFSYITATAASWLIGLTKTPDPAVPPPGSVVGDAAGSQPAEANQSQPAAPAASPGAAAPGRAER